MPSLMDCGFVSQTRSRMGTSRPNLGPWQNAGRVYRGATMLGMNKSPFIEPREVLSNVERDANRVVLRPVAQRGAGLASALAHCMPGWVRS